MKQQKNHTSVTSENAGDGVELENKALLAGLYDSMPAQRMLMCFQSSKLKITSILLLHHLNLARFPVIMTKENF